MSLKLDPRVRSIATICSVTEGCADWPDIINKKGYFANRIADFQDLKKCAYGELVEYRQHDNCFLCEDTFDKTFDRDWYAYFLREDLLQPVEPEKKYRPYSLNEFSELYAIGDVVTYRIKDCETIEQSMLIGFQSSDDEDIPGDGYVLIGNCRYSLKELFNNYELNYQNEWQPFGIIDEDKE